MVYNFIRKSSTKIKYSQVSIWDQIQPFLSHQFTSFVHTSDTMPQIKIEQIMIKSAEKITVQFVKFMILSERGMSTPYTNTDYHI